MGCQLEASRRETRSLGAIRDMAQLGLSALQEGFGALNLAYSEVTLPSAYREDGWGEVSDISQESWGIEWNLEGEWERQKEGG